jgi:hypothetical protein
MIEICKLWQPHFFVSCTWSNHPYDGNYSNRPRLLMDLQTCFVNIGHSGNNLSEKFPATGIHLRHWEGYRSGNGVNLILSRNVQLQVAT